MLRRGVFGDAFLCGRAVSLLARCSELSVVILWSVMKNYLETFFGHSDLRLSATYPVDF